MIKKVRLAFVVLVAFVVIFPTVAFADFDVVFKNTSENMAIYYLYWIDHPFGYSRPANMAGGELEAGEERRLNYASGKYYVFWVKNKKRFPKMFFTVTDEKEVVVTPELIMPESVWLNKK